jgi:dTDP-glucose pyrophosphorylase
LEIVGVVPAAGAGKRIAPLPCSKELYPIGFRRDRESGELRPSVASSQLLEKFQAGGIATAYIVLRDGKWDIPAYFRDGRMVGLNLAYVVISGSIGPPDTVDRAYPHLHGKAVAFGFPDILFGPHDVFRRLREQLDTGASDVVLALYAAHDTRIMDMVDATPEGEVQAMALKPPVTDLRSTWVCALWTPTFSEFLHEFVAAERKNADAGGLNYGGIDAQGDLPMGAVLKAAVAQGLRVHGVRFPGERYTDIGTPDSLVEACRRSFDPPDLETATMTKNQERWQ